MCFYTHYRIKEELMKFLNLFTILCVSILFSNANSEEYYGQYQNKNSNIRFELSCLSFLKTDLFSEAFCSLSMYQTKRILVGEDQTLFTMIERNPDGFLEILPEYLNNPDEDYKRTLLLIGLDPELDRQINIFKKLFSSKSTEQVIKYSKEIRGISNKFCTQEKTNFHLMVKLHENLLLGSFQSGAANYQMKLSENALTVECLSASCKMNSSEYQYVRYGVSNPNCNRFVWINN